MTETAPHTAPPVGLRELRKRRTRERIVAEALRLFAEQGYAATTCEQIAAAAEVSPATFYRYFPGKDEVVLQDEYDPLLVAALEGRPADEHPVEAVRHAVRGALAAASQEEREVIRERTRLILDTPALRARMYEQDETAVPLISPALAARMGYDVQDIRVKVLAAAIFAALRVGVERWADEGGDLGEALGTALGALRESAGG